MMQEFSKHLLILTPGFPHFENDTTNVPYLQDFILALRNRIGADKIKIITIHYPYEKKKYLWNGIEVFPAGGKNIKGIGKLFLMYKVYRGIKKLTQQHDCILHSFWLTDAAMVGQMASKKNGIKHISTAMGQDVKTGNKIFRFLDIEQTTIIALSKNQDDVYFDTTGRHSNYIIPLPLPDIRIDKLQQERDVDLLFVSSFIPLKHPRLFISTVKKLKEKFPGITASMIGDGPLLDEMKEVVKAENLHNVIEFTGKLERSEVFKYMNRAKILLHTSEYEGQCLVFSEALAHGMYVVSYNVGRVEDSEKHIICWNEEELFSKCQGLFDSKMNFQPYQSLDTNAIIEQFITIYNS